MKCATFSMASNSRVQWTEAADNNCFEEFLFFFQLLIPFFMVDTCINLAVEILTNVCVDPKWDSKKILYLTTDRPRPLFGAIFFSRATKCINKSIWIIDCNVAFLFLFCCFCFAFFYICILFCRIICIFFFFVYSFQICFMFPGWKYENNKKEKKKTPHYCLLIFASTLEKRSICAFMQECEKILIQFASSSIEWLELLRISRSRSQIVCIFYGMLLCIYIYLERSIQNARMHNHFHSRVHFRRKWKELPYVTLPC